MNLEKVKEIQFPEFSGVNINMMPIIVGDQETLCVAEKYHDLVMQCGLQQRSVAYLTISESELDKEYQRRPGIHVEAPGNRGWGGGDPSWGRTERENGLYMASTDGATRIWDCQVSSLDKMGSINLPFNQTKFEMEPNVLYWLTDKTPHKCLRSNGKRQFFRLVSDNISIWFEQHSTKNPLGLLPNAKVIKESKFAA